MISLSLQTLTPTPNAKQIGECFGVPASKISELAKKPVVGQMYDPTVTNWQAIEAYLEFKLGAPISQKMLERFQEGLRILYEEGVERILARSENLPDLKKIARVGERYHLVHCDMPSDEYVVVLCVYEAYVVAVNPNRDHRPEVFHYGQWLYHNGLGIHAVL